LSMYSIFFLKPFQMPFPVFLIIIRMKLPLRSIPHYFFRR
jgi:hypothetical protein